MSDLIARLRAAASLSLGERSMTSTTHFTTDEHHALLIDAAGRLEELEKALLEIWSSSHDSWTIEKANEALKGGAGD